MDKDISYVAFEGVCARFERTIKRLWILVIIDTLIIVGGFCSFLWYESQHVEVETTTESYESDATDGGVAIANGDGEVEYNG